MRKQSLFKTVRDTIQDHTCHLEKTRTHGDTDPNPIRLERPWRSRPTSAGNATWRHASLPFDAACRQEVFEDVFVARTIILVRMLCRADKQGWFRPSCGPLSAGETDELPQVVLAWARDDRSFITEPWTCMFPTLCRQKEIVEMLPSESRGEQTSPVSPIFPKRDECGP